MKKRPVFIVLLSLIGLIVVASGVFIMWALAASPASSLALDALKSDESVQVQQEKWLTFLPKETLTLSSAASGTATSAAEPAEPLGFIFYPGARVDYRAYAPLVRGIAQAGHVAIIVPMPLNLAIFNASAATEVMDSFPMISNWVIAGHSLGGAVATQFLAKHRDQRVRGLVLWGSFAMEDISQLGELKVLSVAGSADGLSTPAKIKLNAALLPSSTNYVEIAGANHAQFGSYGDQAGDNPASISPAEQRSETIRLSNEFLATLIPASKK